MSTLKVKDYFRIHIDMSTVVILVLIVSIFYRQLASYVFQGIHWISQKLTVPVWLKDIGLNVISEFISIIILVILGYIYFRWKAKPFFAGKFKAYEISKAAGKADEETEWGTLRLTYNIFSKRIKGILISTDKTIKIEIDGEFDKDRYLRGTYLEKDKPSRLRLGAFLMLLESDGDNYTGSFVHVSPITGFDKPQFSYAKWTKL